jgi:hypothetical protein
MDHPRPVRFSRFRFHPSVMASETLPSSVFESLLPKLLAILQVTQRPEGTSNVRNKQDLLQAVSRARNATDFCRVNYTRTRTQIQAFREALNHARSLASALPGGELLIEEQDDIIAMLERLREKKRCVVSVPPRVHPYIYIPCRLQLRDFSDKVIDTKAAGHAVPQYAGGSNAAGMNAQMEVDSNASTPA